MVVMAITNIERRLVHAVPAFTVLGQCVFGEWFRAMEFRDRIAADWDIPTDQAAAIMRLASSLGFMEFEARCGRRPSRVRLLQAEFEKGREELGEWLRSLYGSPAKPGPSGKA